MHFRDKICKRSWKLLNIWLPDNRNASKVKAANAVVMIKILSDSK